MKRKLQRVANKRIIITRIPTSSPGPSPRSKSDHHFERGEGPGDEVDEFTSALGITKALTFGLLFSASEILLLVSNLISRLF